MSEKQQKLKELDEKYQRELQQLKLRSLKLVSDYVKKADEYEVDKVRKKLKEAHGR